MGGRLTEAAEVARVGSQATAEVKLPESVHRETCGEGIRFFCQPACEHGAAPSGGAIGVRLNGSRFGRVAGAEDREEGGRDDGVLLGDDGV